MSRWSPMAVRRFAVAALVLGALAACGGGGGPEPQLETGCTTGFCGVTVPPAAREVLDERPPTDAVDEVAAALTVELGLAGDEAGCVAGELSGLGLEVTTADVAAALDACAVEIE